MLEKQNSRNFTYWLWFYLLKNATFWFKHHVMENLIKKTCTKLHQNRLRFVKDTTKTSWCVLSVHSSICCSLAQGHYSGEAENVYISVQQTYSGQYLPSFITNGQVLYTAYQKTFWCVFFQFTVYILKARYCLYQYLVQKTIAQSSLTGVTGHLTAVIHIPFCLFIYL